MKLFWGLTALLCLFVSGVSGHVRVLKVGDVLPDVGLPHVVNDGGSVVRTGDFSKGLLIVDFWRTYCGPCLRLFPAYGELQRSFGGRVHFLLVTAETEGKVLPVLERLHCALPCVCRDSVLDGFFPHNSVPHEVWVLNGKIAGFSYGEDVNAVSIGKVLDGIKLDGDKQDDLAFDQHMPLLANGNGSGEVLAQSVITPYLQHLRSNTGFEIAGGRMMSDAINTTVCALYQQAAGHIDPLLALDNRMLVEVPDSLSGLVRMPKGAAAHNWLQANGFCYDLVLPAAYKGNVGQLMLSDLNRYFGTRFGIYGVIEKRRMRCWVVSAFVRRRADMSSAGTVYTANDTIYRQQGLPPAAFVAMLAYQYRHKITPVIGENLPDGPVDVRVYGNRADPAAVDRQLRGYGLRLRLRQCRVSMLVLRSVADRSSSKLKPE